MPRKRHAGARELRTRQVLKKNADAEKLRRQASESEDDARYILWALPRGETDRLHEKPLTSFPLTGAQADKVEINASANGWHSFRRARETNAPPDFTAGIRGARRSLMASEGRRTFSPEARERGFASMARSAATDAGNRSMRAAGRTVWSEDDYNAAVREYNRLMGD